MRSLNGTAACKALRAILRAKWGPTHINLRTPSIRPLNGHIGGVLRVFERAIVPAIFVKARRVDVDPAALARALPLAKAGHPPATFLYAVLGDKLRTILATEPGDATVQEIAAMLIDDATGEPWPDSYAASDAL